MCLTCRLTACWPLAVDSLTLVADWLPAEGRWRLAGLASSLQTSAGWLAVNLSFKHAWGSCERGFENQTDSEGRQTDRETVRADRQTDSQGRQTDRLTDPILCSRLFRRQTDRQTVRVDRQTVRVDRQTYRQTDS